MFCCRRIVQPAPIQSLLYFFPEEQYRSAFDGNDRERNAVFVCIFLPGRNMRPAPDKKICMEAGNQPVNKGKASE